MKTVVPATTGCRSGAVAPPPLPAWHPSSLRAQSRSDTPSSGLDQPGVAGADPNNGGGPGGRREWDIGAYDYCMKHPAPGTTGTTEEILDQHRWCCESTGGVWGSGDNGCHAPSGQASLAAGPGAGEGSTPHGRPDAPAPGESDCSGKAR